MFENIIKTVNQGISIQDYLIYARRIPEARYKEEINLNFFIKKDQIQSNLFLLKLFTGRSPYYYPWLEIFDIQPKIRFGKREIIYFDSDLEKFLLRFFCQAITPGGKIFVEYYRDQETKYQLERDIPPSATRLGYMLFNLGFTWFKDWYFPEGFLEGEQKIQGEKPLNNTHKNRQLKFIHKEMEIFLNKTNTVSKDNQFILRAIKRARRIISPD